ncbi:MAG: hypothetical protein JO286_25910 [Solirubrobacterales bacterium]|nr:hypothetical protein [Solirubrobacterales bacterium]
MLATLGTIGRRRIAVRGRQRKAQPEPEPVPVSTTRATVIDVGEPVASEDSAAAWLAGAGEGELAAGLAVLNRALHAYRIATTDPRAHGIRRHDALVARLGYGAGEQVADGLWTDARELIAPVPRQRRSRMPVAHARLAALLTGRREALVCEELALRARLDLDERREREAALQLRLALDAALAELSADPAGLALAERIEELRALQASVIAAAEHALDGRLHPADREAAAFALGRLEAALRARAAALAP